MAGHAIPVQRPEIVAIGELHVERGDVTAQSFDTTPGQLCTFWTQAHSDGCTASLTTNDITIILPGKYQIECQMGYSGAANRIFFWEVFVNGAQYTRRYSTIRTMGGAGAAGSCSFAGHLDLVAGDTVSLVGESDAAGGAGTIPLSCQLIVFRI
jgi:hypothetical protein